MPKIFIFYSLVSEEKNKQLKLHGPYIHYKVNPDNSDEPIYLFDKDDYIRERKYLSKFLREKSPGKVAVFHFVGCHNDKHITVICECGWRANADVELSGKQISCSSCGRILDIPAMNSLFESTRRKAMVTAEEHFEKKFENMKSNYQICMRKK